MNHDKQDWKSEIDRFKVVQKCPECSRLSLKFIEGKIKCSDCGYEQGVSKI